MSTTTTPPVPNHHADYPTLAGGRGVLFGLLFALAGHRKARLAIRTAGIGPGDHVVDVGCGPGTAVRAAVRAGATAVGVDPSPAMRRVARGLTRPGRAIRWRNGAAEDLGLTDGSATVVWSLATVHHWDDVAAGLAEAARVLRPGGRLVAVERRLGTGADGIVGHGWADAQAAAFATACRDAGFTAVAVHTHRVGRGDQLVVSAVRP